MSKNLENLANNIGSDANKNYSIDPLTILTIISILIQLAKLIYECRKDSKSIIEISRNRPIIESIWLRRRVRSLLSKAYQNRDKDLEVAIFNNIKYLSKRELDSIILEALK